MNSQGADVLNALEHLQCATTLLQKIVHADAVHFDLMCSIRHTAVQALAVAEGLIKQFQSCPGPYWRRFDGVMKQLETINETKKRKMSLSIKCSAPDPLAFDKAGAGPDYPSTWNVEEETRRAVCNQCYQIFMRDKKGGIVF